MLASRSTWLFAAAITALAVGFVIVEVGRADGCTLWEDEVYGYFANIRLQPWDDLVFLGARPQGSPSPLSYLVEKGWDGLRARTQYLGLTPPGYARLPSILLTALLGIAAVSLAAASFQRRGIVQLALATCALALFFFNPISLSYSMEARPYALWNALWFVAVATIPSFRVVILVPTLILLAMTATASCFQIFALAVVFAALEATQGRSWKDIAFRGIVLFAVPTAVCMHYVLQSERWQFTGPEAGTWSRFLSFWGVTNATTWVVCLVPCFLAWKKPDLRPAAAGPGSLLILLFLAPLIYWITRVRGFYFCDRHFLYFSTALPAALLFAARSLPAWTERPRLVACSVTLAIAAAVSCIVAGPARAAPPIRSRSLALLSSGSPLVLLLRTERPSALVFDPALAPALQRNVELIAEWIAVRHASVPRGAREVRILDQGERLVAEIGESPPPPTWRRIRIPP